MSSKGEHDALVDTPDGDSCDPSQESPAKEPPAEESPPSPPPEIASSVREPGAPLPKDLAETEMETSPTPEEDDEGPRLPLTDHLDELRTRIIRSIIAWSLGCTLTYFFLPKMLGLAVALIKQPLIFTKPTEAFIMYLKIALTGGFFVALPYIIWQVMGFVSPGLLPREKLWARRLVPLATILFLGGAAFAYYAVLPVTLNFFMGFQTENLKALISAGEFLNFVILMLVFCGLIFETPLVLLFLSFVGLVNAQALAKNRKYAFFLIIVLAAVATPTPDAFTQLVVAVPMYVLYELSIIMIRFTSKG
jgi:sec-independent protein translocase protein TatC